MSDMPVYLLVIVFTFGDSVIRKEFVLPSHTVHSLLDKLNSNPDIISLTVDDIPIDLSTWKAQLLLMGITA